jgi:hypothetical protein
MNNIYNLNKISQGEDYGINTDDINIEGIVTQYCGNIGANLFTRA